MILTTKQFLFEYEKIELKLQEEDREQECSNDD